MHHVTMAQWQYLEALIFAHHNLHARHMSAESFTCKVAHGHLLASLSISSCAWLCQHKTLIDREQFQASIAQLMSG